MNKFPHLGPPGEEGLFWLSLKAGGMEWREGAGSCRPHWRGRRERNIAESEWGEWVWWCQWMEPPSRQPREDELFSAFGEELYGECIDRISIGENIKHWKGLLTRLKEWKKRMESGEELNIGRAKEYPIIEIAARYGIEVNRFGFIKCPFHADKTASMKIYQASNKWKCYGCQAGGDSIDFAGRIGGLKFVEAVRMLGG